MRNSLIALMLFYGVTTLPAQWHGDGTQKSESCIEMQGLSYLPELHTDMSLDCLIGYIAMDSIARTNSVYYATRRPANMTIPQIRALSRYIYAMGDYDPILFMRHFYSTKDSSYPNEQYRSYPANSYASIIYEIYERQQEFGQGYGMLVAASYVLRVRVTDVREGIDSTMHRQRFPNVNVACEVLEVFKGQHLPGNCAPIQHNVKHDNNEALAQSTCLIYSYPPIPSERPVKVGDEMIIFLDVMPEKGKLWRIRPNGSFNKTSVGRFHIENGRVEDKDNVWGLGINPTLQDFRTNLLQKISDVRSWTWIP